MPLSPWLPFDYFSPLFAFSMLLPFADFRAFGCRRLATLAITPPRHFSRCCRSLFRYCFLLRHAIIFDIAAAAFAPDSLIASC